MGELMNQNAVHRKNGGKKVKSSSKIPSASGKEESEKRSLRSDSTHRDSEPRVPSPSPSPNSESSERDESDIKAVRKDIEALMIAVSGLTKTVNNVRQKQEEYDFSMYNDDDEEYVEFLERVDAVDETAEPPQKRARSDENHAVPSTSRGSLLDKLTDEFDLQEKTGDEINSRFAEIISSFLSKGLSPTALENMKYLRPRNVDYLQKVKINSELWSGLSSNARSADVKLQNIQGMIVKSMIPIIQIANICLNVTEGKAEMPTPEEVFTKLRDAVAMLANTSHEVCMTRRNNIKPQLKEQFKSLCATSNPVTCELLGDNLSAAAKDLNETNRLTQRISAGDHPYKTRGPSGQQRRFAGPLRPAYGRGRGAFLPRGGPCPPHQTRQFRPARRSASKSARAPRNAND